MSATNVIPAATKLGDVVLEVRDLAKMITFYRDIVGLDLLTDAGGTATLGRKGSLGSDVVVVTLHEERSLPLRPTGSAGLYHTAILYDSPAHLAAAVVRISSHVSYLYTGSADHHVSQAFYLDDPEGNGVELYVDRPRDAWLWNDGQVHMTTNYLDPQAFVTEHLDPTVEPGSAPQEPDATTLGHVHLQVGSVPDAHKFYVEGLGFEQTLNMRNQALFVSAGGYHHHLAMNIWETAGAGERFPALGLGAVDVLLPSDDAVRSAVERVRESVVSDDGRTVVVADPWRNLVRLSAGE